jgi:transcriptional regulator with GAF, ATPase, and Fis domain
MNPGSVHSTAEELLRMERFLLEFSSRFVRLPADRVESEILGGLRSMGEFLAVDRVTLTEYLPDKGESYVRFSYAQEGPARIPPMRVDNLFPWTTRQLIENKVVTLRFPDGFPPEATVDRQNAKLGGFKTSINIPIIVDGSVRFILTAASLKEDRTWPEDLVPRLRLFGIILSNALFRKRNDEEIRRLREALEQENISLREVASLQAEEHDIVGRSDALSYVLYRLEQVAPTDATVLLLGETGVGKELFARAIHRTSRRKEKPLLKVDCASLAPSLIESELFGHERGAFTGATATRKGRFEVADGGTVFLDEIGELPMELQPKLLRVLQEGMLERVGSSTPMKVNVRIIAATNRDLEHDIRAGRFRQDLLYRLGTFPLTIPPLRDRRSDIPLLVEHFVRIFSARHSRPVARVTASTMKMLTAYAWPGNVRELENVIERAVIIGRGKTLQLQPLGPRPHGSTAAGGLKTLAEVEKDHILAVLEKTYWRIEGPGGAAKILGLHPDTLRHRMKRLHIKRPKPEDLR